MNKKIKVMFPFVEAGFGHIMTERAICDAFEKKYGNYCEIVRSDFYKEAETPACRKFEDRLCREVKEYNKFNAYGYLSMWALMFFGTKISSDFIMKSLVKHSYRDSMAYIEKVAPDVVISTHWATNYYAEHMKNKPYTVMYVPDAHINELFQYNCDLTLACTEEGLERAKKKKRRYNESNLKLAPLAIRKEAFSVEGTKSEIRRRLGHADKFTVYITEGGYGIGLAEKLSEMLLEKDLPISVIVVCGKNPELYERLKKLKVGKNTSFYPYGFSENVLEMIASSDVYFGKSGNGLMEPAFFGVPTVVTHSANTIERRLADHYVTYVKSAVRIFDAEKCVEFIERALKGDEEYERLKNAKISRSDFGGDGIADIIFAELDKKFGLTEKADGKSDA